MRRHCEMFSWDAIFNVHPRHPSTHIVTVPLLRMSEPSQSRPLACKTAQLPPSLTDELELGFHSLVSLCLYRR